MLVSYRFQHVVVLQALKMKNEVIIYIKIPKHLYTKMYMFENTSMKRMNNGFLANLNVSLARVSHIHW